MNIVNSGGNGFVPLGARPKLWNDAIRKFYESK